MQPIRVVPVVKLVEGNKARVVQMLRFITEYSLEILIVGVLLILVGVAIKASRHDFKVRNPARTDRRKTPRAGVNRRMGNSR